MSSLVLSGDPGADQGCQENTIKQSETQTRPSSQARSCVKNADQYWFSDRGQGIALRGGHGSRGGWRGLCENSADGLCRFSGSLKEFCRKD